MTVADTAQPEPDRWVVVDPDTKTIVGGPYLSDGQAEWTPPEPGDLVREAETSGGRPE